jgi:hypothetical protein
MAVNNSLTAWMWEAWAAVLQEELRENFVWMNIATTRFEWEFDGNDTVNFPYLDKISVWDLATSYSDVTVSQLTETNEAFTLDQRKAFAVEISNEDFKQLRVNPQNRVIQDAAESFADAWDIDILSEYGNANITIDAANVWSTAWSAAVLSNSNIYQFIVGLWQELDEANVSTRDRFCLLSPEEKALLLRSTEFTRATALWDRTITKWMIWEVSDFTIYISNNTVTASSIRHGLGWAWKPINFAANIRPKVEITPSQYRESFTTLIKAQSKSWVKTFNRDAQSLADLQIANA